MAGRPMTERTCEIMTKMDGLRLGESIDVGLQDDEVSNKGFMGFTQRCRVAARNLGYKVSVRHVERGGDRASIKMVGRV